VERIYAGTTSILTSAKIRNIKDNGTNKEILKDLVLLFLLMEANTKAKLRMVSSMAKDA
jgi:hypothetical protein